jgi:hypothetical protein
MPQQLIAENTTIAIITTIGLFSFLAWRVKPSPIHFLRWQSIGSASNLFCSLLTVVLISFAWDFCYTLFILSWYCFVPLVVIFLYSFLGLAMWHTILKLPGNSVVTFCLLGCLEPIPEHIVGIYRFDTLQVPIRHDGSTISIFVFTFFEYMVYWGKTLLFAIGVNRLSCGLYSTLPVRFNK